MKRSINAERAQRINHALMLLKQDLPATQVVDHLVRKFAVSRVQGYRYVEQARKNASYMQVPETSVVFTVKLSPSLSQGIRDFASSKGMSISKAVSAALEDFLDKKEHVQRKQTG